MSNAKLIHDCPERNADLFYATKFLAPDPILYVETQGKKFLYLSDLEFERGRKDAKVDHVFPLSKVQQEAKRAGEEGLAGIIHFILKGLKVTSITAPQRASFSLVDGLRQKGYTVQAGEAPFYPERTIKNAADKKKMMEAQRITFKAMGLAEKILRASTIKQKKIYWKGKPLTSERLRQEIEIFLLQQGYHNTDLPIIACGVQGTDPHERGSGPLKANESIIVDIFPRSDDTRFYGDATRTFCKGKASPELKAQYKAVAAAQDLAISQIKAGVNGKSIYESVVKYFNDQNYPTKEIDDSRQGFIHGVGHGIGLDLHEEPVRIGGVEWILKEGNVVTVEPGLYYRKIGAVRIEDIVYVTKNGCELFPTYPRRLEIP